MDAAEALARADVAMYAAKRSTGARGMLWDETLGMPGASAGWESRGAEAPGVAR